MNKMTWLKIFGGFLLYGLLYLIRDSTFVQKRVVNTVLQLSVVYPKSKSLSIAEPLVKIDSLDAFSPNDIEIKRTDLYYQIPIIVEVFKEKSDDFMIDQVDMIVINKMGVEVLVVDFSKGSMKKGRTLFLELTRLRTQIIQHTNTYIYVAMFIYFVGGVLTDSTLKDFLREFLKKVVNENENTPRKKKKK
jgi:hypothetical protein